MHIVIINDYGVSSILTIASLIYGTLAQWLGQQTVNLKVPGSSPGCPAIVKDTYSNLDENVCKEGLQKSILFIRKVVIR